MVRLIPEMIFAVGKQLMDDGDSEAAMRFALSGTQPFVAMKSLFHSVTTLEMYDDRYAIGWGKKCAEFDKSNHQFLLRYIGNDVDKLHVDVPYCPSLFLPFIGKVAATKKLVTLSIGYNCTRGFLNLLLPLLRTSLKNVTIPDSKMTPLFRDTLNLDSLTVLADDGHVFNSYCCKTTSIKFITFEGVRFASNAAMAIFSIFHQDKKHSNPNLSAVKKLILDEACYGIQCIGFYEIMKVLPCLECIQYDLEMNASKEYFFAKDNTVIFNARYMPQIVIKYFKNPPKVFCVFFKSIAAVTSDDLEDLKKLFNGYEYEESNPELHCFRRIIHQSNATVLEVQFAKC